MHVDASNALLRWYDRNRRRLPWRAEPGGAADPYRIWLSEIMLQQTTVAAVRPYYEKFTSRWPTVDDLAAADEADVMAAWAGLGYYARARNMVAAAQQLAALGHFPDDEAELRKLPGVGAYTAAAIAAIGFDRRAVVVDGNVERIVARLFALEEPLPAARPRIHALADSLTPTERSGDFAQAMMDLGSAICTPRAPACSLCPLAAGCAARQNGEPERFPVKPARTPKPQRKGIAYWLEHDGAVLLVRRPKRGLLGGMLSLPTSSWTSRADGDGGAPIDAHWKDAGAIDHVFTHFALNLRLLCAKTQSRDAGELWWPIEQLEEAGLPSLFAKLSARGVDWSKNAAAHGCGTPPDQLAAFGGRA